MQTITLDEDRQHALARGAFSFAKFHDIVVRVTDATGHFFDKVFSIGVLNVAGAIIRGTSQADLIDATHTVAGQPLPTGEEDIINGKAGADMIAGGAGNDRYYVDNGSDVVTEAGGEGPIGANCSTHKWPYSSNTPATTAMSVGGACALSDKQGRSAAIEHRLRQFERMFEVAAVGDAAIERVEEPRFGIDHGASL